ncbi:MAG TPA: hypothetical protein VKA95_16585 [Nitrososphaeraceae archaeon]|nr:hypothetical protein [Nitrososphaeraceae archaeon]
MIIAEDTSNSLIGKIRVYMFKTTKFNLCVIGMVIGIGLISALPFIGLSCRWCTAGG